VLDSGLRVRPDPRCIRGETVPGAFAHVCTGGPIPYDFPEIQQARRDVLAWWIALLGDAFICVTTLALDSVHCVGAITVATDGSRFADDPFARIFPGEIVQSDLFCRVVPPPGPVVERYSGVAWPGGRFQRLTDPDAIGQN
jgi:hypothetical protein